MEQAERQRMIKMWDYELSHLQKLERKSISPKVSESIQKRFERLEWMLGQATDYLKYQDRDWRDAYYISDMEDFIWYLVKSNRNPVLFENLEELVREYEGDLADQYPVDYFPVTTNELMEKYNAQK